MKEKFLNYPITNTLILLNIFIYLYMVFEIKSLSFDTQYLYNMGAINGEAILNHAQIYRIITGIFLHAGVDHIAMNMLSLWMIGYLIEDAFGAKNYLIIYFISGIVGAISSIYIQPFAIGVGASGAIFGIFGAFGGYIIANRNEIYGATNHLKQFALIIALNLGLGLMIPNIDMSAHIGGLLIGFIGGIALRDYFKIYIIGSFIFIVCFYLYAKNNHLSMLEVVIF